MAVSFNTYSRLEPRPYERNLEAGFSSRIYDPMWFLARQWQMGEYQGENASSPVWINYRLQSHPIQAADARFDPKTIPAEVIVESETDDWWTMGRRVRIGRRVAAQVALPDDDTLRFYNPPPPYEQFHGQFDGVALWRRRTELGISDAVFGAEVPPDSIPVWSRDELVYQQAADSAFTTDENRFVVQRHRGGRMDWYSVDAEPALGDENRVTEDREAIPTPLQYPGAPNSRWWQIENADVDFGGYPPDSAHTPTALLTELIFSHSDDWFLFPVLAKAGQVVMMQMLEVHDAFGRTYSSQSINTDGSIRWPGLLPPQDWSLFQVNATTPEGAGLPPEALLLWHVAELPLESLPVERVQFGLDEEMNLLWSVERTLDAREVESRRTNPPDDMLHPEFNVGKPSGDNREPREYAYVPGEGAALYWHPYEIIEANGRRFLEQRRLTDLSRQNPMAMPAPTAEVLQSDAGETLHRIAPLAVPSNGIEVERRWQLARDMNGQPVLWIQRQRKSLLIPPARRLRFDVMAELLDP